MDRGSDRCALELSDARVDVAAQDPAELMRIYKRLDHGRDPLVDGPLTAPLPDRLPPRWHFHPASLWQADPSHVRRDGTAMRSMSCLC